MIDEQASLPLHIFAAYQPRSLAAGTISDFSGLKFSQGECCEVAPRHADAVGRIVSLAREHGIPVRTRAQGHSLNGSSVPTQEELLLSTRNFRRVRFEEPGSVTVGSGVVLWVLQYMLRQHGFDLPVLNDGYPGPSVGGYISAGGFGPRSAQFGGFWENVLEIQIVDGLGVIHNIPRDNPVFPWLFGSMGQLGVMTQAKIKIIARGNAQAPPYPLGTTIRAPLLGPLRIPPEFATSREERLFWFTLFTPDEFLDEAHRDLKALEHNYKSALRFQERYRYPIRPGGLQVPLVYPFNRSFTATGAWGWMQDTRPDSVSGLHSFDREFTLLATSKPHYRRYVQSELPCGPDIYHTCLGDETYHAFRGHKLAFDPDNLFNLGSVFV